MTLRLDRRLFCLLAFVGAMAAAAPAAAQTTLPTERIAVAAAGKSYDFTVEIADNDHTRAQGLMYRRSMAPDAGMLFDFHQDQPAAFWMKNTFIPLDIIFIRADGTIANIRERAIPGDETAIPSNGPVRAVLELNGGTSSRLGIKAGDKVRGRVFGTKP